MSKPGLLNTGPMMDLINDGVAKHFTVYGLHEAADREALFAKAGRDIRALCTGSHTGVRTDAAMLDRLPNLKIIGNFGVGYDTIDIAEAARRGIIITNTPEVLSEEVADTAIGLLLGTIREFYEAEKWLREGHWPTARRLSADRRLAARSFDRHHRHGPHRPSDRTSAGGLRPADQLLRPQPAAGCRLSATTAISSPWRGMSIRSLPSCRADPPPTISSTCPCLKRWARAASSSTSRAARWSTRRR